MIDPLCRFAENFPNLAARILDRDRHKRRNFREETITDLMIAGLTAFEPFGLRVDFPYDESKTGNDMDWEFVAPHATNGRRYLRLHIQAKRAILKELKKEPSYWYYRELDHEAQKHAGWGSQAARLMDEAKSPGCVPLYMFYHTLDALEEEDKAKKLPAVAGVNAMFADALAPILATQPPTKGNKRWAVEHKKLDKWRANFMPLSDFLCFGGTLPRFRWGRGGSIAFRMGPNYSLFSPGLLADRLNDRRHRLAALGLPADFAPVEAVEDIPSQTELAIEGWRTRPPKAEIARPRAIFLSLEM